MNFEWYGSAAPQNLKSSHLCAKTMSKHSFKEIDIVYNIEWQRMLKDEKLFYLNNIHSNHNKYFSKEIPLIQF